MNTTKRINQLLADEDFQNDVLQIDSSSEEERKAISKKYSLTKKDLEYAVTFFRGISFQKEKRSEEEIRYADRKLRKAIQASTGRKLSFVQWASRVAAVLSIPLLLSTLYFYQKSQQFGDTHFAQEKTNTTFEAPAGAKTQLVLPDGSLVWLNSGSSISFPNTFGSTSRDVELKGEAFFEVVKNEKVPMIVSTPALNVKVYGTTFNLKAFEENNVVEAALLEGRISVFSKTGGKEFFIEPGQAASYSVKSKEIEISKIDNILVYTGWRDGKLIFDNKRFADILRELERWYNVDIQLADPGLGDYCLYATFFDENIEQVLDIFSGSIPISVEYPKRAKQADGNYSKRTIVIKRAPGKNK